jgi:iron(III) transport system ATP-binding protein
MALLQVDGLSKKVNDKPAVSNVSFAVNEHEKLAIAGETGSGKTTLLRMIAGLIQPDAGAMFLQGNKILGPDEQMMAGNPKIGFLSQHFELRNNYRVWEIMEYSNKLSDTAALDIFKICGVGHLLNRYSNALSGGEKQRIALARLLITSPQLLLLDEPFSNLDEINKKIIYGVLQDIGRELQITTIMVSHDPAEILSWADNVVVLKAGNIVQTGEPKTIYYKPANEYVAGLMGEFNLLDQELQHIFGLAKTQNIIRPHQVKLWKDLAGAPAGIIDQIRFHGSYYSFTVHLSGSTLLVYTTENKFKAGDKIKLSVQIESD